MFDSFVLGLTIDDLTQQVVGILGNPFVAAGLIALLAMYFVRVITRVLFQIMGVRGAIPDVDRAQEGDDPQYDRWEKMMDGRNAMREKHRNRMRWRRPHEGQPSGRVMMNRIGQKVLHRQRLSQRPH